MLPIQPRRRRKGNEELASIRVGPAVRHAQHTCASMFQGSLDLVFEFLAVYRAASAPGAGRVASLNHEVGNNAMEDDIVVVTPLSESRKVLTGFGGVVIVELDHDRTLRGRQKIT